MCFQRGLFMVQVHVSVNGCRRFGPSTRWRCFRWLNPKHHAAREASFFASSIPCNTIDGTKHRDLGNAGSEPSKGTQPAHMLSVLRESILPTTLTLVRRVPEKSCGSLSITNLHRVLLHNCILMIFNLAEPQPISRQVQRACNETPKARRYSLDGAAPPTEYRRVLAPRCGPSSKDFTHRRL